MTGEEKRPYGGRSRADRVAERRDRLMHAAAALYARNGRAGASVAAICAEAGLTTRYFYESFASHDTLFLAVFRRVCDHLIDDLRAARAVDGDPLGAFYTALASHPGLARLFLADFEQQDAEVREAGRALAAELTRMLVPDARDRLAAAGAVGAIFRIARLWVEGGYAEAAEDVLATARGFAIAAG